MVANTHTYTHTHTYHSPQKQQTLKAFVLYDDSTEIYGAIKNEIEDFSGRLGISWWNLLITNFLFRETKLKGHQK